MDQKSLSLGEVALSFLTSLPAEESKERQQEINRFLQWYGKERPVSRITPLEIETYAQRVAKATGDAPKKLAPVKELLTYLKKEKLVKSNLAAHLKVKKTSTKARSRAKPKQRVILTPEDYEKLKAQLATLEEERTQIAEELRRAAADKDFRENAPLQAAREQRDQIEARMRQIQDALSTGVLVQDEKLAEEVTVRLGSKVTMRDVASGEKLTYTVVTKNDANPAKSKISIVSPMGRALLNQHEGDVVTVVAPAGELRYQIESIE
jgi:transcription elongation factor GreA